MIRVEFDTDNAVFAEPPEGEGLPVEAARILTDAAERIGNGVMLGRLRDLNGNSVGYFEVLPTQKVGSYEEAR